MLGFQADTRGLDAFDKEAAAFLESARKNLETILANKAFEILEVGPVHQQRAVTSSVNSNAAVFSSLLCRSGAGKPSPRTSLQKLP